MTDTTAILSECASTFPPFQKMADAIIMGIISFAVICAGILSLSPMAAGTTWLYRPGSTTAFPQMHLMSGGTLHAIPEYYEGSPIPV